jgi:hypothetical protein
MRSRPADAWTHPRGHRLASWHRPARSATLARVTVSEERSGPAPAARAGVLLHPRPGAPRFGLLLCAASLSFLVQGAVPPGAVQQVVVTILAGACLLLAVRAAHAPRWAIYAALWLGIVALVLSVVRAVGGEIGEGAARTTNAALLVVGPPAVAVGVVRELRHSQRVRLQAVMGVLSLYLLLGLLYGFVYGALDKLGSGPFFAGGEPATVARCLYYSFTTLATVGYGDLTARTDVGHTLSVSEALLGQIYLVTVVSVLVSNLRAPEARR